jgi:hypothetical protein
MNTWRRAGSVRNTRGWRKGCVRGVAGILGSGSSNWIKGLARGSWPRYRCSLTLKRCMRLVGECDGRGIRLRTWWLRQLRLLQRDQIGNFGLSVFRFHLFRTRLRRWSIGIPRFPRLNRLFLFSWCIGIFRGSRLSLLDGRGCGTICVGVGRRLQIFCNSNAKVRMRVWALTRKRDVGGI